jgi:hypothetical protein
MTLTLHLHIVGALLVLLGISHWLFNRYFGWERELAPISLLTRQVFFVHTFFIGLGVVMAGVGSLLYANALLRPSSLSRAILAGMAAFWLCRLLVQFFVYDAAIWRGNPFWTLMHFVFSALWIYVTATYATALVSIWNRS